jgi:kynurenine aminotransferase
VWYRFAGLEWYLDMVEFAAAFSPRTKAVILNTPHNPTGKVFSREELQEIATVVKAQSNEVVVVCDEVCGCVRVDAWTR